MATINAITYLKNKEDERSHRAQEKETNRANLARESETNRSNLTNEQLGRDTLAETHRSNVAREVETNRANVAKETENNRHNLQTEYIDKKIGNSTIYKNMQQGNLLNAQTARADMDNSELAKLGYTGAAADAQNKLQTVFKTLAEESNAKAQAKLNYAKADREMTTAPAKDIVGSIGSLFGGLTKYSK